MIIPHLFKYSYSYRWGISDKVDEAAVRNALQRNAFSPLGVGEDWGMVVDFAIEPPKDSIVTLFLRGNVWDEVTRKDREYFAPEPLAEKLWDVVHVGSVREKRGSFSCCPYYKVTVGMGL